MIASYVDKIIKFFKTLVIVYFTSFNKRSVIYTIFCGAPGHLRGGLGNVNTAFPLLNALMICGPLGA